MTSRLAILTTLLTVAVGGARAATLSTTLEGAGLSVDSPCAKSVEVTPDPSLHGQVTVQATADHQEEIDHLIMDSHGTARIRTRPGECWQPSFGVPPTLVLTVRVPVATPLILDEAGAGRYGVGAVGGPLSLDLSGAADITAGAITTLQLDISGNGTVHVSRADGPAHVELSGHGNITVDQAVMPTLTADLSGAGHLSVASGRIGRASLETSGAGSMQIGAEVDEAHVDMSGVGSVHFAKVTGNLTKDISGFGSVTVGQ